MSKTISKISLDGSNTYDIKDAEARSKNIISGSYDSENKKIILTRPDGSSEANIEVSLSELALQAGSGISIVNGVISVNLDNASGQSF